ncbi:MAG: class I SAM-dependent methyltransferase [Halobacteriales archaeon]
MTREAKEWWAVAAEGFQDGLDLDVGLNWTGFGADDLGIFEDVTGTEMLELGCGGGQCAVALAKRGADVTGVDISAEQLGYARARAAEHDVAVGFVQGDVTDLGVAGQVFDVAYNAWVFQWVGDLDACFEETYRVLRDGGRFVFSLPHPVYTLADPETHRVEESYFDTGRRVTANEDGPDQVTYRHAVGDVHNALVDAGFRVERLLEPGSEDPDEHEGGPWGEYTPELMAKLPSTVLFEARKR